MKTIRELVDDAVMAMNDLVIRTVVEPTDVTMNEWMTKAILDADLLINQVQDTFDWVKDPEDDAYWAPPVMA